MNLHELLTIPDSAKNTSRLKYYIGFDGGQTKSEAILANSEGEVLAYYRCGDTNHQNIGIKNTYVLINDAVRSLLLQAKLTIEDIAYTCLGLAGADLECDFKILNENLSPIFQNKNYLIKNDAWVALAAGTRLNYGAVSICGTSHNIAVRNKLGEEDILISLSYEAGNFGGGDNIAKETLHRTFRAYEHTDKSTILTRVIPKAFDKESMEDIIEIVGWNRYSKEELHRIPKIVFECAASGDEVAQEIVSSMGTEIGKALAGKIIHAGMEKEAVPVVLSGSLFSKACTNLHVEYLTLELQSKVANADIIINCSPPVIGGVFEAMRHTDKEVKEEVFQKLKEVRF